jgi:3-vinyl bacteriochlorophyllide hydratase
MNANSGASSADRSDGQGARQRRGEPDRLTLNYIDRDFRFATVLDDLIDRIAPSPWEAHAGRPPFNHDRREAGGKPALYSPEQRARRDASPWTIVQGVLAPLQFVAFAISLVLVVRYLLTGRGYEIATLSILVKTFALYTIMITGSVWEKAVFGQWLFARAFFWEDVFSMLVLGLQTAYLASLFAGWGTARQQMMIAVAAYAAYVINAAQFLLKLRAARLEGAPRPAVSAGPMGHPA